MADQGVLEQTAGVEERAARYLGYWDAMMLDSLTPPLHHQLGLQLVQLTPHVVLTMELSDAVRGLAHGSVHGGILATFADIAGAVSLWDAFAKGEEIPVTTDMHVRYYRQPKGGPLRAEARVVHQSRRMLSNECVITDAQERVLARATASYMIQPVRL
jgi:uncharacterized protein (TIGR00369 family)